MQPAQWHGTPAEWEELQAVVQRVCATDKVAGCGRYTIKDERLGVLVRDHVCVLHEALAWNQRFLDHLLFLRRKHPAIEPRDEETAADQAPDWCLEHWRWRPCAACSATNNREV